MILVSYRDKRKIFFIAPIVTPIIKTNGSFLIYLEFRRICSRQRHQKFYKKDKKANETTVTSGACHWLAILLFLFESKLILKLKKKTQKKSVDIIYYTFFSMFFLFVFVLSFITNWMFFLSCFICGFIRNYKTSSILISDLTEYF